MRGEKETESESVMRHDKKTSWDLCAWKCAQQYVMPLLSPYLLITIHFLFLISLVAERTAEVNW